MDELVSPAVGNDGEVELDSLGLGLFDVDVDLAECFKDCPEWNVSVVAVEAHITGIKRIVP